MCNELHTTHLVIGVHVIMFTGNEIIANSVLVSHSKTAPLVVLEKLLLLLRQRMRM